MALSNSLKTQFAKIMSASDVDTQKKKTRTGTAVEYEGRIYVQLDGSDQLTPLADRIAGVKDGDRVTIEIENHSASLTGNLSDPAAGTTTVAGIEHQVEEFNVIIANKADIDQLNAAQAKIDELEANDVTITGKLDAVEADIGELEADNVTINDKLTANEAEIEDLKVTKLDAAHADITYAKIDFANIGDAAIENFFSKSGMIKDLVVSSGTVTGELVGVTIKGDLIEGGTVVADKLVILGDDGLYYKLNTNGETVTSEQTEYNSLSGTIITAKSITAEKIAVDDLVAFGATIGGFHITTDSLYSGVKESIDNSTPGVFMDSEGNFSLGDQDDYLKFFKDTDGNWKLQISASSVNISSSQTNVEEVLDDIQNEIDGLDTIYTTKTEFQQTTNSISASVSEVSQTANSALQKATSVEVTANGLTTTVSEVSDVADAALESAQATASDLADFTNAVNADLSDLQSQIDGSIQTWFYAGVPTLTNEPASEWTTTELKNNHLGDLYYDTDTDYAYRFMLQNGVYSWDRIQDSDAVKALQDAAKAQDTADGKRRVFVTTPTPPYDVGDLWVQGSTGDIMRCQTAKTSSQSYASADWVLASKYTDDTAANNVATDLNDYKQTVSATYSTKTELQQTASSITATVTDISGDVSQLQQTASSLTSSITDLEGNYTQLTQTVDGISSTVSDVEGNVSSLTQTVNGISGTVGDLEGNYSQLSQTVNGFEVSINNANSTANSALNTANAAKKQVWHHAAGTNGTTGYIGIATIKITGTYANVPLFFEFTSRNKKSASTWVRFNSVNGTDPTLGSITADGDINVYIRKTATSTWQLIVQKSEGYDYISVTDFSSGGSYQAARCTVSWTNSMLTSLPSGCTQATRLAAKRNSADIDNAAKTATNYLRFDSSGLCVGNMTGTLGYNALITSSQYQIRNGSTVLSSFGATTIRLGQNSSSAVTYFAGNHGYIRYASNTFQINSDGAAQLTSGSNLTVRGGAYATTLLGGSSSGSVTIIQGNTVRCSETGAGDKNYTPVYRLNNPYASNTKMWTASSSERNSLINAGWTSEGTGWYAFA